MSYRDGQYLITLLIWIGLSFAVASVGSNRKIGYGLTLLACLLLSPLIGLIIGLCSDKVGQTVTTITKTSYKCNQCQLVTSINSHYCPRCFKDSDGYTAEQNIERFNKPQQA